MITFFAPARCASRAGAVGEPAEHSSTILAAVLLVRQLGRIALCGDRDLRAVDQTRVSVDSTVPLKMP